MYILGFINRKTRLIALTVASYLNDHESSSINAYNVVMRTLAAVYGLIAGSMLDFL